MRSRGDSVAAIGQIQAILFDMAGTLCKPLVKNNDRQAEIEQIIRLVEIQGLPAEVEEKLDSRFRAYRKWSRSNSRELTEEDFWTQWMLPEQSPVKIEPLALELARIWWEGLGVRPVRQDLVPVIRELHRRGYRLGIVSNTISSRYAPDLMKRLGIHGLFDIIILSAGFGHRKPHPSIFLEAVRNMSLAPARCAYVGDNPSRDVAGPRKVGFGMTVLIRNPERVLPEPLDGGEHPDEFIDELSDLLKLFVGVKA